MSLVGNKRRRVKRRKACTFCIDKATWVDYKDVMRLRKYVTERGKILPRRVTGNCASHQRMMTVSMKRSREIALLPYCID